MTVRETMPVEELQSGRYRRIRLLGSGGMGEVYLMNDTRVNRLVAIKVLRAEVDPYPDSDVSKDAARLFQREARAIAALEHSNILPLYDFGEEKLEGNSITYMVMPFCPDGSLTDWLRQKRDPAASSSLSLRDVAYLITQAADALQYAHDHQMIHLDVKTSNFLLRTNQKNSNRPTLLLADFGVARSSATTSSSSRTIRGTPTAMAPEHWSSKPTAASDQYSLAVMAYELLTGRPPFVGSMEQLMYQHFTAPAGPPSKLNPQLSPAVDQVLLRALSKKPEDRYPSITAFASALEEALFQSAPQGSTDSSASLSAMPTVFSSSAQAGTPSLPPDMVSALPTQETPQNRASQPSDPVSSLPTMLEPSQSRLSQPSAHFTEHDSPTVASAQMASVGLSKSAQVAPPVQPVSPPPAPKKARSGARIFAIIGVIVLLALVATAAIYGTRLYSDQQQANLAALSHSQTATAQAQATKSVPTATPTPTPPPGLYIAGTYNGSMFNSTTNQTTFITVFIRQTQGSGILNGSVTFKTSPSTTRSLSGTVDKHGNFSFSVQQGQGLQPLVFYGSVQNSVYLHGNFCNSTTDTCDSNTGFFTVGPRS